MNTQQNIGQKETKFGKLSHAADKCRVFIIDDDAGMQSLLTDVFNSQGYMVSGFSDAITALASIGKDGEAPDVVVCDINLPKMNGLAFLENIRKLKPAIPVILITAFGTFRIEQDARQKGAFGYLSKPFLLSEMTNLVKKAVETRK